MADSEKKPYAVVLFPEETKEGKQIIDLVPSSWLTELTHNKWNCYFPPNDQKDTEILVKDQVTPSPTWKQFPAEIIKTAGNYKQGIRRLEKACENLNAESTAVESTDTAREEGNSDEWEDENDTHHVRHIQKVISKRGKKYPSVSTVGRTNEKAGNKMEGLNQLQEVEKNILKHIKAAKQSILYDINKKCEELKNTVVINQTPNIGTTLKQCKETLGVKLPFEDDEVFKEFNRQLKKDDEKDTSLRALMVQLAVGETDEKGAMRKILGGIMAKSVQELYSAAGRAGANGKIKQSLSVTPVYACMKDVILELFPGKTGPAAILSMTSRYLSGAGDREGGKRARATKAILQQQED